MNGYTPVPGRRPRGLRLTSQSGARLGLEVRQRDKALSRNRTAAQNADSGMDAALRPEAWLHDSGPHRTGHDTGPPPGIRLAARPGAGLDMEVQFRDTPLAAGNFR